MNLELPRHIEHTLLRANATEQEIRFLCAQARENQFYGAVVNPVWVKLASELLAGSTTGVVTVVGFPLGANRSDIKVAEAIEAAEDGAVEIDMVANIGWLCENRLLEVETEIRKVRRNLPSEIVLKVIIETSYLDVTQQQESVIAIINAGAQFVKTGTGYYGPATVDHVLMLVEAAHAQIGIKASGGITTYSHCLALLDAGANRLGTSSSIDIMAEMQTAQS